MDNQSGFNEQSFLNLGIAPRLLQIIAGLHFTTPTEIQRKAIPIAIEGKDIVGIAQTGTGKTLAFAVPMLQRLMQKKGAMGLVVVPTRELAAQIEETYQAVGRSLGLKTALLIGGAAMGPQIGALRRMPHVVIGTPGRINDHIQQKTLSLNHVFVLVLDEADHMFDMGFLPQIKNIIRMIPQERQTMLFSATMPNEIFKLATGHMRLPVRIEIARSGTVADRVDQELFIILKDQKNRLLEKILGEHKGSVLIFCRMKFGVKRLCAAIRAMGHNAAEIHSNRTLGQRREALEGFKSGRYRILVATDIAARGIDVVGIELVVNYDLPEQAEDYVHRIGRTGRAGMAGKAITIATPDQRYKVKSIERLIRTAITVSQVPSELPPHRTAVFAGRDEDRSGGRPFGRAHGRRPFHSKSPRRAARSFGGGYRGFKPRSSAIHRFVG